nr:charged ORF-X protein [tobacco mosaic virus TMV, L, Peptide, 33 aa] [Tobacco mosaic virus]
MKPRRRSRILIRIKYVLLNHFSIAICVFVICMG